MLVDPTLSKTSSFETVFPTNAKNGKEGMHVKFLYLFDVFLVQNPGHTSIQKRRDNHSSGNFQLHGNTDD